MENLNFKSLATSFGVPVNAAIPAGTDYVKALAENVPEGKYRSDIVGVDISKYDEGEIHCYQKLTSDSGESITVLFILFEKYGAIAPWVKTFAGYGFEGALDSIVGTVEEVEIKHGVRLAYIANRKLVSLPPQTSTPSPSSKKRGGLLGSSSKRRISKPELLVDDEDDDEWSDLDDLDEDEN